MSSFYAVVKGVLLQTLIELGQMARAPSATESGIAQLAGVFSRAQGSLSEIHEIAGADGIAMLLDRLQVTGMRLSSCASHSTSPPDSEGEGVGGEWGGEAPMQQCARMVLDGASGRLSHLTDVPFASNLACLCSCPKRLTGAVGKEKKKEEGEGVTS